MPPTLVGLADGGLYKSMLVRLLWRVPVRTLYASPVSFKKVKGKKEEDPVKLPSIPFEKYTKRFEQCVERFSKQVAEVKAGKANTQLFDNLAVATGDGEANFRSVAQTSIAGRNFVITVFDPANRKHVVSAVLASSLNLNPVADKTNPQILKIPLPPVSAESRKNDIAQLKAVMDKHKVGGKDSLAAIRAEARQKYYKRSMTDDENKAWTKLEELHKKFADKIAETFKGAEKALSK